MRQHAALLSLDFNSDGLLANHYLLESNQDWPGKLIVMLLHRVGSGQGIDWQQLEQVCALAGERKVYAAGGIADVNDIEALAKKNIAGVLIASAIHQGKITTEDIERLSGC